MLGTVIGFQERLTHRFQIGKKFSDQSVAPVHHADSTFEFGHFQINETSCERKRERHFAHSVGSSFVMPGFPLSVVSRGPFNELDGPTLTHIMRLVAVSDALHFAEVNRRTYSIFQGATNLRQQFDYVNATVTLPSGSVEIRLHDSAVLRTSERTLHIENESSSFLLTQPDFSLVDGEVAVFVRYQATPWHWNYRVTGGSELDGLMTLLKFFQRRFPLDELLLIDVNKEVLDFFANQQFSHIRQVHVVPAEKGMQDSILRFITSISRLSGLALHGHKTVFRRRFFDNPIVRNLQLFAAFKTPCMLTNKRLLQVNWTNFICYYSTHITLKGLNKVIEQWQQGQREFGLWVVIFKLSLTAFEDIAQLLLGDSMKKWSSRRVQERDGVIKSHSGKEMQVWQKFNDDVACFVLDATNDPTSSQFRHFWNSRFVLEKMDRHRENAAKK